MKFSVLLPIYEANHPGHLKLALTSLLDQTRPPDEILLVEDGPITQVMEELVSAFALVAGGTVKRLKIAEKKGLVNALNAGIKGAEYELIARMDADDICTPDRFARQLEFFETHPDYSLVGGQAEEFRNVTGDISQFRKLPLEYNELVTYSRKRCPFNHPTVMYKKSMLLDVGGYRQFSSFEDYYLWAKIINAGYKVANLPDVLLYYRLGHDFVKRRKGLRYFSREYALLKEMRRMGFLSRRQYAQNLLRRLPLRIMPDFIVKWVYWYFLR